MHKQFNPKNIAATLLVCLISAVPLIAQIRIPPLPPDRSQVMRDLDRLHGPDTRKKERERQASERQQREFSQRMAEFAKTWNALVKQSAQGTWNAKQAEKTRKAFEKLIHSEGWLENKKEADLSAATGAEQSARSTTQAPVSGSAAGSL